MIEVYNKKHDVIVRIYTNKYGEKRVETENDLGICNAPTFEECIKDMKMMGAL